MRSFPRALFLSTLSALVLGCGQTPLRPKPITDVRLDLTLSAAEGSRERPLTIRALARNVGTTTVHHIAGCGCAAIGVGIFDAQDAPVAYLDPCLVWPACPCWHEPFAPGARLESRLDYEGDAYRLLGDGTGCVVEDLTPGTYTVIVRYHFFTSVLGDPRVLERSARFRWTRTS